MPICEADPWRLQYFENVPCPDDVRVPTEDGDAWLWFPRHRWVYNKLEVAASQGLTCGPHGLDPPSFPVFSKPIYNLRSIARIKGLSIEDIDAPLLTRGLPSEMDTSSG